MHAEPNPFEVDDNEMCDIYFNGWPLIHYNAAEVKFHDDTIPNLLKRQWEHIKTTKDVLVWRISNYLSNLFFGNQTNNNVAEDPEDDRLL